MPNPRFKAIWVPLPLHRRIERIQRRMVQAQILSNKKPAVPTQWGVAAALDEAKMEQMLEMDPAWPAP